MQHIIHNYFRPIHNNQIQHLNISKWMKKNQFQLNNFNNNYFIQIYNKQNNSILNNI